ncbi:hypothetical protein [Candidatus Cyanaurora vandensis]|uniref:hypothetical protein n=1 Tax=Candidatus Cyanaurora vandensis TaxID=2714958 RepID=UPI00257DC5B3|nr:hypothetical protein [Candidatus Cyanaurora vandensis]
MQHSEMHPLPLLSDPSAVNLRLAALEQQCALLRERNQQLEGQLQQAQRQLQLYWSLLHYCLEPALGVLKRLSNALLKEAALKLGPVCYGYVQRIEGITLYTERQVQQVLNGHEVQP